MLTLPAQLLKDAKFAVTVIGVLLMILNEVVLLPIIPAADQHWVTGAIAVLTILGRDITDLTGVSAAAKAAVKAATRALQGKPAQ